MLSSEKIRMTGYTLALFVLIFGFLLFFYDTHEWQGSLFAALLSSLLVLASFVILHWLYQTFTK